MTSMEHKIVLQNPHVPQGARVRPDTHPGIPAAGAATKHDNSTAKNSLDVGFKDTFHKKSLLEPMQHIPSKLPPNITAVSEKARRLTHGMISLTGEKSILFPIPSDVHEITQQIKEQIYKRTRYQPLGKGAPSGTIVPESIKNNPEFAFGTSTVYDANVKESLQPNLPNFDQNEDIRRLYKISHRSYAPGERKDYRYDLSKLNAKSTSDDHGHDPHTVKDALIWFTERRDLKSTWIVNKKVEDFNRRMKPELGKVFDPMKDTISHLSPSHLFGVVIPVDKFNVKDLLAPESEKQVDALDALLRPDPRLSDKITMDKVGGHKPQKQRRNRHLDELPSFLDADFTFGDPTIKKNHHLGPDGFKKLSDKNNYGDELNTGALLNPKPSEIYGDNYVKFKDAFIKNNCQIPAPLPTIYSSLPKQPRLGKDLVKNSIFSYTSTEQKLRKLGKVAAL